MTTTRFIQLATAAILLNATAFGAEGRKPTISVPPTESQLPIWQPALGEGLAHMILTELTRLPNVEVLESLALDDLVGERALGESGEVNRTDRIRKGNWKGAEYTFKTVITRFGASESESGGGLSIPIKGIPGWNTSGSINLGSTRHEVQIDWRVVDNTTRAVVKSGRGTGIERGRSVSVSGFGGGGFSNNREFAESALGKATMKAISSIVTELEEWNPPVQSGREALNKDKLDQESVLQAANRDAQRSAKGEVLLVEGDEVWLNLGSSQGFSKGDRMTVFRKLEKRNKAGQVVVVDYEPVGEIELIKVLGDKSCGRKLKEVTIEEGAAISLSNLNISKAN